MTKFMEPDWPILKILEAILENHRAPRQWTKPATNQKSAWMKGARTHAFLQDHWTREKKIFAPEFWMQREWEVEKADEMAKLKREM